MRLRIAGRRSALHEGFAFCEFQRSLCIPFRKHVMCSFRHAWSPQKCFSTAVPLEGTLQPFFSFRLWKLRVELCDGSQKRLRPQLCSAVTVALVKQKLGNQL